MDRDKLRPLMIQHKHFLNRLYKSNQLQAKSELASATSIQLRLLLSVIHHCASGSIPIRKPHIKAIEFINYHSAINLLNNKVIKFPQIFII